MSAAPMFSGFPKTGLQFFHDLAQNNNREWFEAHKQAYLDWVLAPAQSFVLELGLRLQSVFSDIVYDTRTNGSGSIRRINRDIRFSKDKTPYHTNLGMSFWKSGQKRNEGSGFYVHVNATGAEVYTGMYMFDKPFLEAYRQAVVDDELGIELEDAIASVEQAGGYKVGGEAFKRVPAGYDPQHPRAALLRHGTLHASSPHVAPEVVSTPEFVDVCFDHCRNMAPLHQWLVRVGEQQSAR